MAVKRDYLSATKKARKEVLRRRLDRHKLKFRKWAQELAELEKEERGDAR